MKKNNLNPTDDSYEIYSEEKPNPISDSTLYNYAKIEENIGFSHSSHQKEYEYQLNDNRLQSEDSSMFNNSTILLKNIPEDEYEYGYTHEYLKAENKNESEILDLSYSILYEPSKKPDLEINHFKAYYKQLKSIILSTEKNVNHPYKYEYLNLYHNANINNSTHTHQKELLIRKLLTYLNTDTASETVNIFNESYKISKSQKIFLCDLMLKKNSASLDEMSTMIAEALKKLNLKKDDRYMISRILLSSKRPTQETPEYYDQLVRNWLKNEDQNPNDSFLNKYMDSFEFMDEEYCNSTSARQQSFLDAYSYDDGYKNYHLYEYITEANNPELPKKSKHTNDEKVDYYNEYCKQLDKTLETPTNKHFHTYLHTSKTSRFDPKDLLLMTLLKYLQSQKNNTTEKIIFYENFYYVSIQQKLFLCDFFIQKDHILIDELAANIVAALKQLHILEDNRYTITKKFISTNQIPDYDKLIGEWLIKIRIHHEQHLTSYEEVSFF